MKDVILRMENMVKTFPGTVANKDISLEVMEGEIHCLLRRKWRRQDGVDEHFIRLVPARFRTDLL